MADTEANVLLYLATSRVDLDAHTQEALLRAGLAGAHASAEQADMLNRLAVRKDLTPTVMARLAGCGIEAVVERLARNSSVPCDILAAGLSTLSGPAIAAAVEIRKDDVAFASAVAYQAGVELAKILSTTKSPSTVLTAFFDAAEAAGDREAPGYMVALRSSWLTADLLPRIPWPFVNAWATHATATSTERPPTFDQLLARLLSEAFGDNAGRWEIFAGMAPSFSGTVAELISAVTDIDATGTTATQPQQRGGAAGTTAAFQAAGQVSAA